MESFVELYCGEEQTVIYTLASSKEFFVELALVPLVVEVGFP